MATSYDNTIHRAEQNIEIQECDGFGRFRTIVKDFDGKDCVVAFYPDSYEDSSFDFKKLKRGHTLAIISAYQHEFSRRHARRQGRGDGRRQRYVIPASLQVLRDLGPEEEKYGVDRPITEWKCYGCDTNKPSDQMSRCGRCKIYAY